MARNSLRDFVTSGDQILPSQWKAFSERPATELNGDRRLRLLVLQQSMWDLQDSAAILRGDKKFMHGMRDTRDLAFVRSIRAEAIAWVEDRGPGDDEHISFNGACEALDLDADYVRGKLRASDYLAKLPRRPRENAAA